jgi:hypothetical protein
VIMAAGWRQALWLSHEVACGGESSQADPRAADVVQQNRATLVLTVLTTKFHAHFLY